MIPMSWYLVIAAALFCVGLFGVLSRRNAVGILIGVELMLNAVNINLLTFWHYYIQVNAEPPLNAYQPAHSSPARKPIAMVPIRPPTRWTPTTSSASS